MENNFAAENQAPYHNMLQQITDLQKQFRAKYNNEFQDIFERTISKMKLLSKCFTLLVSQISFENGFFKEITDWSVYRLFWYTTSYNLTSVSYEGRYTALNDNKIFSPENFVIKNKNIYSDTLQVSLQKLQFGEWHVIGESIMPLMEVCGATSHNVNLYDPTNKHKIGQLLVSNTDIEQLYACNVNSPLHQFVIDVLERLFRRGRQSWRNESGHELKDKILKIMVNMHGNTETRVFNCISRNIQSKDVNNVEIFYEAKDKLPGNPLVSGTAKWLFKKPLIN